MTEEVWKAVVGFEGAYEVSDQGNLRSLDRIVTYRDGRIACLKGSRLRGTNALNGYVVVVLSGKKRVAVHRLVMEAFIGIPVVRTTVNHRNGNKADNRLENLEYNSFAENNKHARNTGLNTQHAEICNLTRYSEQLVSALKNVAKEYGASPAKLSELFGVSERHVADILSGKSRSRG